jgi:hypothetical protein
MNDFALEFHTITGLLALLGSILLIWHMNIAWPYIVKTGQRLRYITLLWASMTVAYGAVVDIKIGRLVETVSILFTLWAILLITTMVISIRETRRTS